MTGPEHVRCLGPLTEWASEVYHGVALTSEDRAAVEKLSASADDRLQIEELRQGLRVRTRSWVGVVRLPTVEIRVVPKVTGDLLGLVRLLEYAVGARCADSPSGRCDSGGFRRQPARARRPALR